MLLMWYERSFFDTPRLDHSWIALLFPPTASPWRLAESWRTPGTHSTRLTLDALPDLWLAQHIARHTPPLSSPLPTSRLLRHGQLRWSTRTGIHVVLPLRFSILVFALFMVSFLDILTLAVSLIRSFVRTTTIEDGRL